MQKEKASLLMGEITLVVNPVSKKIGRAKIPRKRATKRESVLEGILQIRSLTLRAVRTRGNLQGQREGRTRKSGNINQEDVPVKVEKIATLVLCHFLDSLETTQKTDLLFNSVLSS